MNGNSSTRRDMFKSQDDNIKLWQGYHGVLFWRKQKVCRSTRFFLKNGSCLFKDINYQILTPCAKLEAPSILIRDGQIILFIKSLTRCFKVVKRFHEFRVHSACFATFRAATTFRKNILVMTILTKSIVDSLWHAALPFWQAYLKRTKTTNQQRESL